MATDDEARLIEQAQEIEARVGHPGRLWETLKERAQADGVRRFRDVQDEWLALMWSLDEYRRQGVPPIGMGNPKVAPGRRLGATYRTKGNVFAELLALLLQNRTAQRIRPRTEVRGFSQLHQIDLAWPSRDEDVRVCAESKVTGAPPTRTDPSRGALSDFSNRRKELKFTATDLKLWRRQQEMEIGHWGAWRATATPRMYFLWAARLRTDRTRGNDDIGRLIMEAKALVDRRDLAGQQDDRRLLGPGAQLGRLLDGPGDEGRQLGEGARLVSVGGSHGGSPRLGDSGGDTAEALLCGVRRVPRLRCSLLTPSYYQTLVDLSRDLR